MVFPLLASAIYLSDGEWPASNYTLKTNIKVKVLDFVQLGVPVWTEGGTIC